MKNSQSKIEPAQMEGSLRLANGVSTVHIEAHLSVSADTVWSALTDTARLAIWLGTFEGELRPGGDFRARFLASEWDGTGRVEVCKPTRHVRVSLTQTGDSETHIMEARLVAQGDKTKVVVEESGMPPEQLAAYGAGVQIHVEDLMAHLSGGQRCDAPARWKELFPLYKAKVVLET